LRRLLAKNHIDCLMKQAMMLASQGHNELAERSAKIARKISKWLGFGIRRWRYFFCKHCKSFIFPDMRVRVRNNRFTHIVILCKKCGNYNRIRVK